MSAGIIGRASGRAGAVWAAAFTVGLVAGGCVEGAPDPPQGEDAWVAADAPSGDPGGVQADAVRADRTAGTDAGPAGPPPPTWWQCRMGLTAGTLSAEDETLCDAHHTSPPPSRRYGVRWVFLGQVEDPEAWALRRLESANAVFAPAGIQFETDAVVVLSEASLKDAVVTPDPVLGDLMGDVALHLELDATDPQEVLSLLRDQLVTLGVAEQSAAGLTLTTPIPSRIFFGILARARPEVIHVMVMDSLGGSSGMSNPPGYLPNGLNTSLVFLKALEDLSPVVLPHELGHFFGLKHPHGESTVNGYVLEAEFADGVEEPIGVDFTTALGNWLGPSLEGPLGEPYVAYNLPFGELMLAEALRIAILEVWLLWGYVYREGEHGPEAFDSLTDYLAWGDQGGAVYRKNVTWSGPTGPGGNCGWDVSIDRIRCLVGASPTSVDGLDPFLDQTILLDGGTTTNIMTYIAKLLVVTDEDLKSAFTPAQLEVLRVGANTPVRQLLRNLALR